MSADPLHIAIPSGCACPKCRILRALGEREIKLDDAAEAIGQVIAILSADLEAAEKAAVQRIIALAWIAQTAAQSAEPNRQNTSAPRAPTAH